MGIVSKLFAWGVTPLSDDSTITQWGAGLVLVLMVAFLWSTVIRQIE